MQRWFGVNCTRRDRRGNSDKGNMPFIIHLTRWYWRKADYSRHLLGKSERCGNFSLTFLFKIYEPRLLLAGDKRQGERERKEERKKGVTEGNKPCGNDARACSSLQFTWTAFYSAWKLSERAQ